jgi:hypothetical protein
MSRKHLTRACYRERTEAIARFTGRFYTVIPLVISAVFFNWKQAAGSVLKLESNDGGILSAYSRWLPGGLSAYTLSAHGCKVFGFPSERSERPGAAALDLALGIPYYCTLAGPRRYRVEHDELVALLGRSAPARNVPHIWTDESGGPQILRVYQTTQNPAQTTKRIHAIVSELRERPILNVWMHQRLYGLAVLVPSSTQLPAYRRAVERAELNKYLPVYVGLGPTAETLATEVRRRKTL